MPDIAGSNFIKPYIEIVNAEDFSLIWTNKDSLNLKSYRIKTKSQLENKIKIQID